MGPLAANPVTFKEESGMDFQAVTVKTPDGENVPFLFTVKKLFAKGEGNVFKPGFTWSGQFEVPTYQNGAFQDATGATINTGSDEVRWKPVPEPAAGGQKELLNPKGNLNMDVVQINEATGEIGGTFLSTQPGDTNMGTKEPKTIRLQGTFYGKVVPPQNPE